MATIDVNSDVPHESSSSRPEQRWLMFVVASACFYYLMSAMTLPFSNSIWLGEFPPLAIVQLPKSFLKFVIQECLLSLVHALGWSQGSASPDYIATHGWAMVIMTILPAILLVSACAIFSRGRLRTRLIAAVLVMAMIDAAVTLWFDASSSFKLYNASYF
ncbi:MAG: hypothetical protein HUJ26_06230 [Planctomycetaceae bacterium]|nr:hypothetical protein [Planctomycetaceae bacterium]